MLYIAFSSFVHQRTRPYLSFDILAHFQVEFINALVRNAAMALEFSGRVYIS